MTRDEELKLMANEVFVSLFLRQAMRVIQQDLGAERLAAYITLMEKHVAEPSLLNGTEYQQTKDIALRILHESEEDARRRPSL